jgi:hypothetical protein
VTDPLEAALQRIESIRVDLPAPQGSGAVEYSFIGDTLEDPRARLAELSERLLRTVSQFADIRTPVACTTVEWNGGVTTTANSFAGLEGVRAHVQAVTEALARRIRWFRILIASTSVVTTVAAAIANPVSIPSAFRAGWKLVGELESVLGSTTS